MEAGVHPIPVQGSLPLYPIVLPMVTLLLLGRYFLQLASVWRVPSLLPWREVPLPLNSGIAILACRHERWAAKATADIDAVILAPWAKADIIWTPSPKRRNRLPNKCDAVRPQTPTENHGENDRKVMHNLWGRMCM
jgi:hypothetical protein